MHIFIVFLLQSNVLKMIKIQFTMFECAYILIINVIKNLKYWFELNKNGSTDFESLKDIAKG